MRPLLTGDRFNLRMFALDLCEVCAFSSSRTSKSFIDPVSKFACTQLQALGKSPKHAHGGLLPSRLNQRDVGSIQIYRERQRLLCQEQLFASMSQLFSKRGH